MRPVNLLPPSRRVAEGGNRPGIAYVVVGALGALLLGVVMYVLTANGVTAKQDELAKVTAETQAAQQRAAALGHYGNFASIKRQREASITQLARARLDWERLVRELARVVPEDVYISSLDASISGTSTAASASGGAAGPSLNLTGCAPSNPAIATLMVRLRKLHRAKDVSLANAAKSSGEGGECGKGYGFRVTVAFEPAAAGAEPEQPVPARLGGGA